MTEYNHRFIAYALSRGKTPEQVLEETKFERVSGTTGHHMHEFMIWISQKVVEFQKSRPECCIGGGPGGYLIADDAAFDKFIGAPSPTRRRDHSFCFIRSCQSWKIR